MNSMTFQYRICDGPMFDTSEQAWEWAEGNIAGGVVWLETLVWCATCSEWVVYTTQEAGCPDCGGKWTPMGDGEWYAFDGGNKAKHQAYLAQRKREQDALKAWQAASAWAKRRAS